MIPCLAAYLHRLDPFAVRLWGDFGIRWYGLSYLAGFAVAYLVVRHLARRKKSTLRPEQAMDFIVAVALGTVIGGRLGYVLFYKPQMLVGFSSSLPFWDVLALNKGGMASHGGLLGIVVACLWWARRHAQPAVHLMDLIALSAPIGVFFGRIANFVNGELLGRPCDPAYRFAVKFPQEIYEWSAERLESPEYQRVAAAAAEYVGRARPDPHTIVELVQRRDDVAALLEPLLTPRHPSQLYEALLEGAVLFTLLLAIWARPRKPGVISGWFLIGYGVVRIIGEQFRMPDAHIAHQEFATLGITRGQLLSLIMVVAGAALLTWWSRRDARKLGGWASPNETPKTPTPPRV